MLPLVKNKVHYEEKTMKQFRGINVRENYASGDIEDEVNMSARMYPSLCTRNPRKISDAPARNITGTGNYEGLIFTYEDENGRKILNFSGKDYDFSGFSEIEAGTKRTFASISDTVMIIPDNLIFTPSTGVFKKICVNQYGNSESTANKFAVETNNSDLLDKITNMYLGKVFHNSVVCRNTTYTGGENPCEFYFFAFDTVLKPGDVITLKMDVKSDKVENNEAYKEYRKKIRSGLTLKIKDITSVEHNTLSGFKTETVALTFDDYAIDTGGYSDLVFEDITVQRNVPELRDICSFNNRIWGITDREICCSKLGDASEWNDFSVDAYGTLPYACFSSPAPTEGVFNSVISFGNYIYAFKENVIHKIYGDNPDEFAIKTIEVNGVAANKMQTVAKSGYSVLYCSYNGIYSFDGTHASMISYCLKDGIDFECGESDGEKYYVTGRENGKRYVYVYDIRRKIWHREDAGDGIEMFCRSGKNVYAASGGKLILMNEDVSGACGCEPEWDFTVRFDEKLFEKKGFGKISVRYSLGKNAYFTVRAVYDGTEQGAVCGAKHDESFGGGDFLHMPVRRCRSFALRFRGKGFFCLRSMGIKYYRGSEI